MDNFSSSANNVYNLTFLRSLECAGESYPEEEAPLHPIVFNRIFNDPDQQYQLVASLG